MLIQSVKGRRALILLEQTISERLANITIESLDEGQLHTLKRHVLDSYAGICASLKDTAMLRQFERLTFKPGSGPSIDVWGVQKPASIDNALFMNAILARRSDLVNTYFSPNSMGGGHPSDSVALVLTLADWLAMDSRSFLNSTYLAFYLSAAFSTFYDPESANYDHDAMATFHTALVIGRAMGLSKEQLTEAQRIAGMLGLDINQAAQGNVTEWKHCTYASCALRGLQAVRMARAGFHGPPEIYEGEAGINQFLPHADAFFHPPPDLQKIIYKRWPGLVFCQTPIDLARKFTDKLPDPKAIASVDIYTYAVAIRNGAILSSYHPGSRAGRSHSIPYCVSLALLKPVEYEDFGEAHVHNVVLNDLMAKVKVFEDPRMTRDYPAKTSCRMTITLADGSTIRASRDYPRGDPQDPLSDLELESKLRKYFLSGDDAEADRVIDFLWRLEEQRHLDVLLAPLKRRRIRGAEQSGK